MAMKTFHISIAPSYILMLHRQRHEPLLKLMDGVEPGTTELDIEIQLLCDMRDGKVYTIGKCDNKDENGRCKGHDVPDEPDEEAEKNAKTSVRADKTAMSSRGAKK